MTESSVRSVSTTGRITRIVVTGLLLAIGAFVVWQATNYELGTLRRMGPGYFPLMLGASLCLLAALIWFTPDPVDVTAEGAVAVADIEPVSIEEPGGRSLAQTARSLLLVLGAMAAFAALVRHTGFAPATAAATCVAGLADPDNSLLDLLLLASGVTVAASLIFIVALGVPVPLFAF